MHSLLLIKGTIFSPTAAAHYQDVKQDFRYLKLPNKNPTKRFGNLAEVHFFIRKKFTFRNQVHVHIDKAMLRQFER